MKNIVNIIWVRPEETCTLQVEATITEKIITTGTDVTNQVATTGMEITNHLAHMGEDMLNQILHLNASVTNQIFTTGMDLADRVSNLKNGWMELALLVITVVIAAISLCVAIYSLYITRKAMRDTKDSLEVTKNSLEINKQMFNHTQTQDKRDTNMKLSEICYNVLIRTKKEIELIQSSLNDNTKKTLWYCPVPDKQEAQKEVWDELYKFMVEIIKTCHHNKFAFNQNSKKYLTHLLNMPITSIQWLGLAIHSKIIYFDTLTIRDRETLDAWLLDLENWEKDLYHPKERKRLESQNLNYYSHMSMAKERGGGFISDKIKYWYFFNGTVDRMINNMLGGIHNELNESLNYYETCILKGGDTPQ